MKRYRFSLEAVLRVRRAQEEAAGFALAHANRQRQQAVDALDRATDACAAVVLVHGAQDLDAFRSERDGTDRRAAAVAAAAATVERATEIVTARQADWSAAARLVAAIERLEERRREEWRAEEQKAEMAAIDESAIAGWLAEAAATPRADTEVPA